MLCCLGDLVEDIAVRRPAAIRTGGDTDVRIARRRGGSAANTAVAAAALDCPVRFIGRVGDDASGRGLVTELEAAGVEARVQLVGRTGTILVLIEGDGDRTMLRDRAAAAELDAVPSGALDGASWLHVPAYSLVGEPVAGVAAGALRSVRDSGGSTSVDVSSVTLIDDPGAFVSLIRELRPDVVFANEAEFAELGGEPSWVPEGSVLVVKRGPGPATVYTRDTVVASREPATLSSVSDTTGAGDAFAAGYIAGSMTGATIDERLETAHRSAAAWIAGR